MKAIGSAVLFFVLITVSGFPQGEFLQKGESGIGISANYNSAKDLYAISGSAAYSFNGIFDIGLNYIDYTFRQYNDFSATGISPFIRVHLVKHKGRVPFSLAIAALYENTRYSTQTYYVYDYFSQSFGTYKMEMSQSSYGFNGVMYWDIGNRASFYVQPSIGFTYMISYLKINGIENSESEDAKSLSVGLSFVFQTKGNAKIIVHPEGSFTKERQSFSFGAGVVF